MIYSVEDSSLSDALNKSHGQIDRAFKHKTKASACAEAASRLVGRFEGRGRHLTSAATKRIGSWLSERKILAVSQTSAGDKFEKEQGTRGPGVD